jgi:hypothetical protein
MLRNIWCNGRAELPGYTSPLAFTRDSAGMAATLPEKQSGDHTYTLKINTR